MWFCCHRRQPAADAAPAGALLGRRAATNALTSWGRLFTSLRRIRRLQRLFNCTGVYLQKVDTRILLRLSLVNGAAVNPRRWRHIFGTRSPPSADER